MKDSADDNLQFEENGKKLFKPVENTVRKEEIACYEEFLLFPKCFQTACFPWASKGLIVWEWLNNLEKTVDKEKMLVTSFFSFSHNVLYPPKTNFNF